jgi:hypothetical protein
MEAPHRVDARDGIPGHGGRHRRGSAPRLNPASNNAPCFGLGLGMEGPNADPDPQSAARPDTAHRRERKQSDTRGPDRLAAAAAGRRGPHPSREGGGADVDRRGEGRSAYVLAWRLGTGGAHRRRQGRARCRARRPGPREEARREPRASREEADRLRWRFSRRRAGVLGIPHGTRKARGHRRRRRHQARHACGQRHRRPHRAHPDRGARRSRRDRMDATSDDRVRRYGDPTREGRASAGAPHAGGALEDALGRVSARRAGCG